MHIVLVRWADGEVKIVPRRWQLQPGSHGLLKRGLLGTVSTLASRPATQLAFFGMGLEVGTRRIGGCSPILDTLSQDESRKNQKTFLSGNKLVLDQLLVSYV